MNAPNEPEGPVGPGRSPTQPRYDLRLRTSGAFLALAGEFDLAEEARLRSHLRRAEARGDGVVVVDVVEVTFVERITLQVLDEARCRLMAAGRRLELRGVGPRFRRVCRVTGYLHLLGA